MAGRHRETILALHTHTQPAQPSTVAHYLLAMIEQLERDATRLQGRVRVHQPEPARRVRHHRAPGSRSTATLTSRLLGFDGPTGNTYGSIATVDYLLESVTATAVLLTGLGRFVQDMLLWCTAEFGYLRLGDGFVQGSSIMPQKRNPVALEHARAIGSKALGQATAVMLCVHNTPFGDIVDTEDDLQPLVDRMFRDAARALTLVGAAMAQRRVRRREAGAAGRRGLDHDHGAGRHAGARARPAVRHGARHRRRDREGARREPGRRSSATLIAVGVAGAARRADPLHRRRAARPS